jgi:hypothetical protein
MKPPIGFNVVHISMRLMSAIGTSKKKTEMLPLCLRIAATFIGNLVGLKHEIIRLKYSSKNTFTPLFKFPRRKQKREFFFFFSIDCKYFIAHKISNHNHIHRFKNGYHRIVYILQSERKITLLIILQAKV